jgi:hypothetical protein
MQSLRQSVRMLGAGSMIPAGPGHTVRLPGSPALWLLGIFLMPVFGFAAHLYCAALLPEYSRLGPLYEPLAIGLSVLCAPLVGLTGRAPSRDWVKGQRALVVLLAAESGGWLFVVYASLAVAMPYLLALSLQAIGYSEVILVVAVFFYGVGMAVGLGLFLALLNLRILVLREGQVSIGGFLGAPLKVVDISAAPEGGLVAAVNVGPPQSLWLSTPLVPVSDSELEAKLVAIQTAVRLTLADSAVVAFEDA